ncbi:MAG: cold shock domain-containing protein [Hydrogenophaga sp.]|uniref:cold-shock protein n=1 Tax=Hydrogenophaga sp. TaxID=1904254 RepID=UPI002AB85FA9|nr:cold shock domain-containing protein [Hydrogenophaga sp.]MDZ4101295.1 cold shock domain-containing protein [Hydrogenophaga sp.]
MRKQGTVVRWDPAKAFGFIRSEQTAADIFFHIKDFSGHQPPGEGLPVTFQEIHVGGKGPRALSVEPLRNEVKAPFETPKA